MAGKKRTADTGTFEEIRQAARAEGRSGPEPLAGTAPELIGGDSGVIRPRGPAGEELRRVRVLSDRAEIRRWLHRRGLVGIMDCGATATDWVEGHRRTHVVAELLDGEPEAARFEVYRLPDGRRAVVVWRFSSRSPPAPYLGSQETLRSSPRASR